MTTEGFPWINIPMIADTGEQQVFVQRREELAVLYRGIVEAGNAVRAGRMGVHRKFVVHGYLGVGKSALILEVLRMLRAASAAEATALPEGLPTPEDPERWLILRVSGKHVFGLDGMVESLRRSVLDDERSSDAPSGLAEEPRLALYARVHEQVAHAVSDALQLPALHNLLRTREARLYAQVRADLRDLAQAIEAATHSIQERKRDEAHLLVEILNRFFRTASVAGLPTLLVLDDFDDLAAAEGASAPSRARMLDAVLSEFSLLAPSCLIVSLRGEYMNDSLLRQYRRLYLPPLTRMDAALLLSKWAEVQRPSLDHATTLRLQQLGDRFLRSFAPDEPVVVPFRFLQLVAWLANNLLIYHLQDADDEKMLWRYFGSKYPLDVVRALRHVVQLMPAEHVLPCASASPLPSDSYVELTVYERLALEQAALLRPALARECSDPRLVLDPLCAYLNAALPRQGSPRTP